MEYLELMYIFFNNWNLFFLITESAMGELILKLTMMTPYSVIQLESSIK